jgi:alanine racemase
VQPGSDFAQALDLDIEIAVASLAALQEIQAAAKSKPARIHLEVDTGMSRGGFLNEWNQLSAEHLKAVAACSEMSLTETW